jgi:glyoxylase I family protein
MTESNEPLPLVGLHHISIVVADVERSGRFYCDVMGFRAVERPDMRFPGAWLLRDNLQLHLIGGQDHAPDASREISSRDDHLAFAAGDLDDIVARLKAKGIAYRENRQSGSGLRQIFFHDPEGRTLEVATYPPHPRYLD